MKTIIVYRKPFELIFIVMLFLNLTTGAQTFDNGIAEDNWGNRINIDDTIKHKTTLIVPFSTSNCGYCLVDGYFAETNYIKANIINGGASFYQCLFNPQLEIYSFEKHFGYINPVLTYPPQLNKMHDDGFPAVLAFKNGKQVFGPDNFYSNYDNYSELRKALWNEYQKMIPTGNYHIASRFVYENETFDAVIVYPVGWKIDNELREKGVKFKSFSCKNIDSLTETDYQKHLMFNGNFNINELLKIFNGKNVPFLFTNKNIEFGNYSFPFDSVGMHTWFPSPFNSEKYIVLNINHGYKLMKQFNYLDFSIYTGRDSISSKLLMYGNYENVDGKISIIPEKTFSDITLGEYCKKQCKAPVMPDYKEHASQYVTIPITTTESDLGKIWTIGSENCRFPDVLCDSTNGAFTTYEENGDILLTNIATDKTNNYIIESDETDSYNPKITSDGKRIWVFYLNNKDTYYRLYARFLENNILSDEILISEKEPADIITINVAAKNEEIGVTWSEWKANFRYLKLRKINDGVMQKIIDIPSAPSVYAEDYSDSWYPSLCYLSNDELWGAWNQHYPSFLGVIAGKIGETPQSITLSAKKIEDWEIGGYPCIFCNNENKLFTVYESNGWDTYSKKPQQIKISTYNNKLKKWSLASIVSNSEQTFINQTPVGICDKNNDIFIVWSGRPINENSVWGIYLSVNINGTWKKPILISKTDINSRFQKISYSNKTNSIWISWHAGIGKEMKTEIINIGVDKLTK